MNVKHTLIALVLAWLPTVALAQARVELTVLPAEGDEYSRRAEAEAREAELDAARAEAEARQAEADARAAEAEARAAEARAASSSSVHVSWLFWPGYHSHHRHYRAPAYYAPAPHRYVPRARTRYVPHAPPSRYVPNRRPDTYVPTAPRRHGGRRRA